jgi:hypothetical protein
MEAPWSGQISRQRELALALAPTSVAPGLGTSSRSVEWPATGAHPVSATRARVKWFGVFGHRPNPQPQDDGGCHPGVRGHPAYAALRANEDKNVIVIILVNLANGLFVTHGSHGGVVSFPLSSFTIYSDGATPPIILLVR